MGRVTGDKGKFNRERKKKLVRREVARALRKSWAEGGAKPAAKAAKPPKAAPTPAAAEPAAAE